MCIIICYDFSVVLFLVGLGIGIAHRFLRDKVKKINVLNAEKQNVTNQFLDKLTYFIIKAWKPIILNS